MIEQWDEKVTDLQDEYTLLGELQFGDGAVVYRARHRARAREVLIRVLPAMGATPSESVGNWLTQMTESVATMRHRSIIPLHAINQLADGSLALVAPKLSLRTLRQAVAMSGAFEPEQVERLLRDVASALSHAHEQGVVHEDLSPDSIFVEVGTGRAMLGDFGLAAARRLAGDEPGMARTKSVYRAPEQLDGASADARENVYSLGVIAWELLTGRSLTSSADDQSTSIPQVLPAIDSLRPGVVPLRTQYVVERMLRKDPHARFAGSAGFLASLNSWVVPSDWEEWEASLRARCASEDPTLAVAALPALPSPGVRLPFERPDLEPELSRHVDPVVADEEQAAADREELDRWRTFDPIGVEVPDERKSRRWQAVGGGIFLTGAAIILAVFWPSVAPMIGVGGATGAVFSADKPSYGANANDMGIAGRTDPLLADDRRKCRVMNAQMDCLADDGASDELTEADLADYGMQQTALRTALTAFSNDSRARGAGVAVALLLLTIVVLVLNRKPLANHVPGKDTPLFGGLVAGVTAPSGSGPASHASPMWKPRRVTPKVTSPIERRSTRPGKPPFTVDADRRAMSSRAAATVESATTAKGSNGASPKNDRRMVNLAEMLGTMADGHLVHYGVPTDGGLPDLPGRLLISSGFDNGSEIRFVQSPGVDGTVITFGRSIGEIFRHVRLEDDTISRTHARMELIAGSWRVLNLARSNAVVHNGQVMSLGEERLLHDGDTLEMGEVLFTYRFP